MRLHVTIAAMTLVLSASAARGQEPMTEAREQVKAADIDYRLGRFVEALAEYTKAYELYPVPPLLFNIGQCHRHLKDHSKAIFFFEGYLRDEPAAKNRPLVEDLIRESKAELDKQAAEVAVRPPAAVEPPRRDEPHDAPGRPILLPSLLVGGGLAAVAGGGAFYYYGQKHGPDEMYIYADTRWLGGAMMGLGGAAIVAGAIVWARGPSSGAPVAAVAPAGGYVGWVGVF